MPTNAELVNRPAWVDLATSDAAAARDFYAKLFGWDVKVSEDPRYGGYATAHLGMDSAGGIGPRQTDETPTTWSYYIGTQDVDALARAVEAAGGKVLAPPFDVGDQGRMAVFQDPTGAVFSGWQGASVSRFVSGVPNAYAWAELNARGLDRAVAFYEEIFGWTHSTAPFGDQGEEYTTFEHGGEPVAGALEMNAAVPDQVPSYWLVYFLAEDVDATFRRAVDLGANEMVAPQDFPGGRFAIVSDPQGGQFGLLKLAEQDGSEAASA